MSPEIANPAPYLAKVPKTAMAVTVDIGEKPLTFIPRKKEPVGARLALAARAIAYGEKIEYSGPVFEKMTTKGKRAILNFSTSAAD